MATLDRHIQALVERVTRDIILPRYRNLASGDVEDKGGGDPVTVADKESEAALREGLSTLAPGVAFVGEELVHADPATLEHLKGDCWIVDPIDGTRNFASGQPPFGILIARAEGGLAQSGWIYDCLTGRFCIAHRGAGAFVDGARVTARTSGDDMPVAAISLVYMDDAQREAVKQQICPHYSLVDIPYCAAEQYPRLALGQNDVSIFERTLAWDHAAGVLWLEEAGGKAARHDGSAYRVDEWERTGLIGAASPALWEEMAARLQSLA
ncbi:inositol monophosphatase family protein [Aurantiacibacter gangjinensis]|uniref:Inositol monophosphatase n=1 Tax=Aurantiacibacter gangjinensis TaxID=502682 RepID=A0A0G9MQZ8_9SPHN|nr:inositol monophosphatase family protein [Aurantiacibacter gangjinensis]APE28913.1 Inositol-1-monophosphatase [Aurantiacibacter gangjinensis]KLE33039.1 inositol monophosphatase [Aurantiacibacter gangjinensis]